MTSPNFLRTAGWAAILSSTLKLGDTFSVVVMALMALMIAVALTLHLLLRSQAQALSFPSYSCWRTRLSAQECRTG